MTSWLGHIKAGKEFQVEAEIIALGIDAWVPRRLEIKRVGKRRSPKIVERPYLPNAVFLMNLTDAQWHEAQRVKFMSRTMRAIYGERDGRPVGDLRQLYRFREAVEVESAALRHAQQSNEALEEFQAGEALQITKGPFSDMVVEFLRVVRAAHELHPHYEVELELMGQKTRALLDPLDVRAAVL